MPLYIVRWPSFNVSLVKARNEDELVDLLDEVADPAGCRWAVYRGPVWIDLDLPLDVQWDETKGERSPRTKDDAKVTGVEKLHDDHVPYEVSIGECDTGVDMHEAVTRWAFPNIQRVFDEREDEVPELAALRAAVKAELRELVQYTWRAAQVDRRSDPEAVLLRMLGLTAAPPWMKALMKQEQDDAE